MMSSNSLCGDNTALQGHWGWALSSALWGRARREHPPLSKHALQTG